MMRYLSLLLLAFAGCQNLPTQLTTDESKAYVTLAKQAALNSGILTPTEKERLDAIEPSIAYYFLSRPLADYTVRWKLSEAEEIVVSGRGDIFRLENATVKRTVLARQL